MTPWASSASLRPSTQLTGLYEVFDADPPADRAAKLNAQSEFERAQTPYRLREFEAAAEIYDQIAATNPNDGPASKLAARCKRLAESGVPDDWNAAIHIEKTSVSV